MFYHQDLIKKIQARRRLSKTDEVKFDIIVTKSDDNADDFQIEELENFVGYLPLQHKMSAFMKQ